MGREVRGKRRGGSGLILADLTKECFNFNASKDTSQNL